MFVAVGVWLNMVYLRSAVAWLDGNGARLVVAVVLLVGTFAVLLSGQSVPAPVWVLDGSAVTFFFAGQSSQDR